MLDKETPAVKTSAKNLGGFTSGRELVRQNLKKHSFQGCYRKAAAYQVAKKMGHKQFV